MASDRVVGSGIFAGSIIGMIVYVVLLFYWEVIVLAVTAFVAVALLLGILAWIGYTMATTPSPEPFKDITEPATEAKAEPQESGAKRESAG